MKSYWVRLREEKETLTLILVGVFALNCESLAFVTDTFFHIGPCELKWVTIKL